MSGAFTDFDDAALARLIAEYPLSWIVPSVAPESAIAMPVLLECDNGGTPISLLGHLPRNAPATAALARDDKAQFHFLGHNRYISPTMAGRQNWAPTWNFESARMTGSLVLDENLTLPAVEAIVRHMEPANGWDVSELGERLPALLDRIIGFRARLSDIQPRFKLGQDEDGDVFRSIVESLGDDPLANRMREARGE